ncbi:MAG: hypothetical protein L3J47_08685 [Sulfurovum sp.]|nr:hypothetical protein [Sulfurovum sp.]
MTPFPKLSHEEPIAEVIKAAFDATLPIQGGWGYTMEEATVFTDNPDKLPLPQLEHMIASMRAYLEMNMTQPKEERYGSINLNEKSRETFTDENKIYHKITYEVSAMKEDIYAAFIDEYKEGYGKDDFDMEDHFKRRKEATLIRVEPYWFEVGSVI